MAYVISTYTLPEAQWKCIQSKATTVTLQKIGFNPHSAHAMIFCPKYGVGLRQLHTEQQISKVITLFQHLHVGDQLGELLILYFGWINLTIEQDFYVLWHPHTNISYLDHAEWGTPILNALSSAQLPLVQHTPFIIN